MATHHARQARAVSTLIFLCMLIPAHGAWAGPPTDQLREGVEQIVKTLRDPELMGDKKTGERRAAISTLAGEIFDFAETARRALGPHWGPRTPAEREEFVRLFTALVQRTYIAKVDQYNAEMTFEGDKVDGGQAVVRTTLALNKGGSLSLDYRMHQPRDRWRVYDINVDGISLVANYRTQFNKIIRTESYDALVTRLKSHQADVAVERSRSEGR